MKGSSAASRVWSATLILLLSTLQTTVRGHVQLAYPPPTLKLDFLDSFRTRGICGHSASGNDNSGYWRLPEPDKDTVTPFEAGSDVTISWDLHYAHQGGFLLELYNSDLQMVSTWNDSSHWGCNHDGTQQSVDITLPEEPCEGCILRLQRQALEWGEGYRFHSCSLVDISDITENAACNECSGHGTCVKGKCECQSNAEDGFWYGQYCERQNECEEDADCGTHGLCIDTEALTAPTKQCYCEEGYFGKEVVRGSTSADLISTRDCSEESDLVLGDPEEWENQYPHSLKAGDTMSLYYLVDKDAGEIEFAVKAKTTNWLSFGLRAASIKGADESKSSVSNKEEGESEKEAASEEDGSSEEEATAEDTGSSEGAATADSSSSENEADVDTGTAEPEGRRKLLARMPDLDNEAEEPRRILLAEGDAGTEDSSAEPTDSETSTKEITTADSESETKESESENTDLEPETEAEAAKAKESDSDADSENSPSGVGCTPGDPTIAEYDEGVHFKKPVATGATLGDMPEYDDEGKADAEGAESEADAEDVESEAGSSSDTDSDSEAAADAEVSPAKSTPGRRLTEMPKLEEELHDPSSHFSGRSILEDDADAEGEASSKSETESEETSDSSSEPESESAASGDSKTDGKVYFATGTPCENLVVDNPAAHPMINQDMIVAYAKGEAFRIQDTFTPSRARPSPDIFFGGTDDIIDAVGRETDDGYTLVKFRRKIETDDQGGDYCIMPEINYFVIYAIGQGPNPSHSPASSLETGRASNKNFYGEDELKYHGGGIGTTFPGRGGFGLVNFFEEVQEKGSCSPSTLEEFDCMSSELGGAYELHWLVEDDGVKFGAKSTGNGWIALGFPDTPGVMVGSDAVLGWDEEGKANFDVYKLESKSPAGIMPGNDAFEISDVSVETTESSTLLLFKREFDDSLTGDEEDLPVLVAFHVEDKDGFSHHGANRGSASIDLTAAPSDNLAIKTPCVASDLEGFECVSEQLDGKIKMNWKNGDDGVKMALVLDGTGYVAVAWPEVPGQMVGADAVIAWISDEGPNIGVYKMESKSASGVIESDVFEVSDAEISVEDGKTTLTFTRPFDTPGRRKLLFTADSGPTDLLFAYHDSDPSLVHHTARVGTTVDLQQEPPAPGDKDLVTSEEDEVESGSSPSCEPSDIADFTCMTKASDLEVHWENGANEAMFAVRAPVAGYVALGWPSSPGVMIGSKAVIGWSADVDDTSVGVYTLDGKSPDAVNLDPSGLSGISDLSVEETDGVTTMYFTRASSSDFIIEEEQQLIFAYNANDELEFHQGGFGSLSINLVSGEAAASNTEDLKGYRKAHGWLMFVGWGALLPIGIIVARTLKDLNPAWFYFHLSCQIIGMLVAIAGWIIALIKFDPESNFRHGIVGTAVMVLGLLQSNAFLRPKHGAPYRELWEYLHWSVGRVALVLAIYNIFTGLDRYAELYTVTRHNHVTFGMWILALFVVYLVLEARSQRIRRNNEKKELEARLKSAELPSPNGETPAGRSGPPKQVEMHQRPGVAMV